MSTSRPSDPVNPPGVRWLWLVMAVWSAWVIWHGSAELSARYEVVGLERSFSAPVEHPWGWLLDARPGALWDEVHQRYAADKSAPAAPADTPEAWTRALAGLALTARPPTSPWTGARPRIRFHGDDRSPTLLIGLYGTKSVLYDPALGVVVPERLDPTATELELVNAREAPW